jgi:HAMP domain-containing protein
VKSGAKTAGLTRRVLEIMTKVNSNRARRALKFLVLIALMAGSVLPAFGQRRRVRRTPRLGKYTRPVAAQPTYHTVAANTLIRVRMNEEISSGNARIGDRFTTTVVDPVYASGLEVIPAGSIVTGRVTSVNPASRKSKAGTMGVGFVSVQLPNGVARSINGSLTDVTGNSASSDNEGQVSGRSSMKRNVVFIGGGAATGALIGAIAGGGRGAGIGAGVGAGLGVAGAIFSKGKEAVVKRGTEFGVVLNQSVALPAANVR